MNPEILMLLAMGIGGIGFALGGTQISDSIKGQKWIRRDLTPALLALLCLMAGFDWWRCLGLAIGLDAAFRLGYGGNRSWWLRFVTICVYPLPTLFLGFSVWQIIMPVVAFGLFKLSNVKWAENVVVHKIFEFLTGALVGVIVADLIRMV